MRALTQRALMAALSGKGGRCGQATAVAKCRAMSKPHVSLRINCPLPLYEKIGEYRHAARHETRAQAMTALITAGLAALAKPPALPTAWATDAPVAPPARSKLVPYAGAPRQVSNGRP